MATSPPIQRLSSSTATFDATQHQLTTPVDTTVYEVEYFAEDSATPNGFPIPLDSTEGLGDEGFKLRITPFITQSSYTAPRSWLGKHVTLTLSGDTALSLPPLTLADTGKQLLLLNTGQNAGLPAALTITVTNVNPLILQRGERVVLDVVQVPASYPATGQVAVYSVRNATYNPSVAVALSTAQSLLTSGEVVTAPRVLLPYQITGLWNGDTTEKTVYVFGLSATAFASVGWVVTSGVAAFVRVDVASGTYNDSVTSGRFRDSWKANTRYEQDDIVQYMGQLFYASTAFTSGSAFSLADWSRLLPNQQPVTALKSDNSIAGFNTLQEAFINGITSAEINVDNQTVTATNNNNGRLYFPAQLKGNNAIVTIVAGVPLYVSPYPDRINNYMENVYFRTPSTNPGVLKYEIITGVSNLTEPQYATWEKVDSAAELQMNAVGFPLVLSNSRFTSITGTGTVILYGNSSVDSAGPGITVIDRRPGIVTSPDGTRYRIVVANGGTLSTVSV